MMHTRCRQFLLLMFDFKTQNKEEEQVKKDEPVKPKSNSKPRQVWQNKVEPPLEMPLLEAPPQESSSSRANRGTRSMNFHNYQGQYYEATSSGHQGGHMSFSGRGYHDS